ncbi:MAG: ribose ABC transporter [Gammaproteobacteria bacterium]|nr:ribose ABC transporter [Gammaproteobacteria bacterium]
MLKNINPLLGPQLLKILREMGHGDEIAIVDANYPAQSSSSLLVRIEGMSATDVLSAVISVLPLDQYVEQSAFSMQVVDAPDEVPEVVTEFQFIVEQHEPNTKWKAVERFTFYEQVKKAYAIISTGENRLYGNVILKKGVINP